MRTSLGKVNQRLPGSCIREAGSMGRSGRLQVRFAWCSAAKCLDIYFLYTPAQSTYYIWLWWQRRLLGTKCSFPRIHLYTSFPFLKLHPAYLEYLNHYPKRNIMDDSASQHNFITSTFQSPSYPATTRIFNSPSPNKSYSSKCIESLL